LRAAQEIVLCAGALASPKILLNSGVGPAEHLREFGVEVVVDLPGVGENFQDHMEASVQCELNQPISMLGQDKGLAAARHMAQYVLTRTGLLTSTVVEAGGFADVSGLGEPDVQFHVRPVFRGFGDRAPEPGHGITISPCVLRPQSRGKVRLRSTKPGDPARFFANAFSAPADMETLVKGIELTIRITEAPSLARLVERRALPKPGVEKDPAALRAYIRDIAKTVFHPAGTCKMGPESDALAVVSQDLKVRGVEGLRVADASIMPTLVSGNTNAPVIMIGERAARFLLHKDAV
jgi:choline dehydrogenase-like flavoprotein